MANTALSKQQLKKLAKQIKEDQSKPKPAEKPVKIDASFKAAVKKMGRTASPKK